MEPKVVKVTTFLGEDGAKKVFTNAAKTVNYHVPPAMRDDIEEGDYVVVAEKHYFEASLDPQTGEKMLDEDGNVIVDKNKPFTRIDVTFRGANGTQQEAILALREDDINDAVADDIVKEAVVTARNARKTAPAKPVVKKNEAPVTEEPAIGG